MSVINQVLDQLDRRGAHAALKQNMVRVVPQARRNTFNLALVLAGGLLLVGLGALTWWALERDTTGNLPQAASVVRLIASAPVSSVAGEVEVASVVAVVDELAVAPEQVLPATHQRHEARAEPVAARDVKVKPESKVEPVKVANKKIESPQVADAQTMMSMPLKQVSRAQQADAEFRRGIALMKQGRSVDAIASYEAALHLDAAHDAARQALVALLLESKRALDAERVLKERLETKPEHTGFAMLLARQQVERGEVDMALATLERSLSYAEAQAEYRAFYAALLQRSNRHPDAATHYQAALKLQPNQGVWLMGYGISLQALRRDTEAKAAFQRALESKTLSPELQAFVQQRLKAL